MNVKWYLRNIGDYVLVYIIILIHNLLKVNTNLSNHKYYVPKSQLGPEVIKFNSTTVGLLKIVQ